MKYLYIVLIVLFVTAQFTLTKVYQKNYAKNFATVLFFNTGLCFVAALFFFFVNRCTLTVCTYTLLMSLLQAVLITICHIIAVLVVRYGRLSVYSTFMMLGGMILPFFYGIIFLGEKVGVCQIIGLVILIVSPIIPAFSKTDGKKNTKLFYVLCVLVFVMNGLCCVVSKAHQTDSRASGTNDFIILLYIFASALTAITVIIYKLFTKRKKTVVAVSDVSNDSSAAQADAIAPIAVTEVGSASFLSDRTSRIALYRKLSLVIAVAIVTGLGYMFQLLCAKEMPASVLYPLINGSIIIATTVGGRVFFKEKPDKLLIISLVLTLVGVVLFAL